MQLHTTVQLAIVNDSIFKELTLGIPQKWSRNEQPCGNVFFDQIQTGCKNKSLSEIQTFYCAQSRSIFLQFSSIITI